MSLLKGHNKAMTSLLIMLFVAGILVGGLAIFFITINDTTDLQTQVTGLRAQISELESLQNATYQNITIYQNGTSLSELYESVKDSVVLIQGTTSDGSVQGSGFVYSYQGRNVVVTNYHVVEGTTDLSVTFQNGNGYSATVLGTDPHTRIWQQSPLTPQQTSSNQYKSQVQQPYALANKLSPLETHTGLSVL